MDKKGISGSHGRPEAPKDLDVEKKKCADIFQEKYQAVLSDVEYVTLKDIFKKKYG